MRSSNTASLLLVTVISLSGPAYEIRQQGEPRHEVAGTSETFVKHSEHGDMTSPTVTVSETAGQPDEALAIGRTAQSGPDNRVSNEAALWLSTT